MIYPDWPAPNFIKACVTTRWDGNLADPKNQDILQKTLSLPAEPFWLNQVHGNRVVEADTPGFHQADASYSFRPGAVCAVLTADCLPVLLCDKKGTCVAAVHAGWKGLLAGILEATVEAISQNPAYPTIPPKNILAWLGPAIGKDAFMVQEEVRVLFIKKNPILHQAFTYQSTNQWYADIYALARFMLHTVNVTAIYGGEFCTYQNKQFFSFRRDQGTTGRMASLVWR